MLVSMFEFKRCTAPGCDTSALPGLELCANHYPRAGGYADSVLAKLSPSNTVKNISLAGLRVEGMDLSGKRFYACSFMRSSLKNVTFAGCTFRMCFFDFSEVDSCDFSGLDAQFCSFAGARLFNASFENSELIHNNFDGIRSVGCTFNGSNLYNSRFIMAEFEQTDFKDCNAKNTFFPAIRQHHVSWKYTNTEEAVWNLDGINA